MVLRESSWDSMEGPVSSSAHTSSWETWKPSRGTSPVAAVFLPSILGPTKQTAGVYCGFCRTRWKVECQCREQGEFGRAQGKVPNLKQRRITGGKMNEEVNVVLGMEENKAARDDGVCVEGQ
jgi:hypothetical protein